MTGAQTTCRSCRAPIVFAVHGTTGRRHPFEADAAGVWVIENGIARHAGRPDTPPAQLDLLAPTPPAGAPAPRWTSHFERCPHAGEWRRR
jgi:hypothetical protein